MRLVTPQPNPDHLVLSLGREEAVILFQPGALVRGTLERRAAWVAATVLLAPWEAQEEGLLAILPRAAAPALLAAAAGHPVERDLQEIVFSLLSPAERPFRSAQGSL
jgi:hypothetical protein